MKRFCFCFALLAVSQFAAQAGVIIKETLSLPAQMVVTGTTPIPPVFQNTNVIWKVKLSLPVAMSTTAAPYVILRKTLAGNDIVNLALGRKLGTKVDAKTEVLALDVALGTGTSGQFPASRLVIYDTTNPNKDDTAITKVLATNSTLDWQTAFGTKVNSGFGLLTGTLSTSGTTDNGLTQSSLMAAGSGSYSHTATSNDTNVTAAGAVFIEGELNFVYTDTKGTHTFNGIVVHGTGSLSGKPLGSYTTPGFVMTSGTMGTIVKKTLAGNDIVNLALGRPLGTKVNTKTEVLALDATFETSGTTPRSHLVIYDTTQNGQAGIKNVLSESGPLFFQNLGVRSSNSGFGFSDGTLVTSGSAQNGLFDSNFQGAGTGSGKHLRYDPNTFQIIEKDISSVGSAFLQGELKFIYTDTKGTHNFDGIYIKGSSRVSGTPIGGYDTP